MDPVRSRPACEIGVPGLARVAPAVVATLQPALILPGLGRQQAIEAPARRRLVEALPGPLDDDERPARAQCSRNVARDAGGVIDVVQRPAGHDGIDRAL